MNRSAAPVAFELRVNGAEYSVSVDPATPLLYVLRNDLGLNGPKFGCGLGECGACTILLDEKAVRSCVVAVRAVGKRSVTTLEGLGTRADPGPVQAAFIAEQAAQCGYCINGMIMTAHALLKRNPHVDAAAIARALRYNLCRCGTHVEIMRAVKRAAAVMAGKQS
jgi:nicotinate dehydrogenase subunit A